MKNEQYIEPLTLDDLEEVHALIINTIKTSYFEYYPKEAIDFFIQYSNRDAIEDDIVKYYVIILKQNNTILGTGSLVDNHIKRVFVNPELQGNGLGKLIMKNLENHAYEKKLRLVELHSSLFAKRFYDQLGYKMFKIGKVAVANGEILYYQRMAKSLVDTSFACPWKLNNKTFKTTEEAAGTNGFCGNATVMVHQNENLFYVEYKGEGNVSGEAFGVMDHRKLYFYYTLRSLQGKVSKGELEVIIDSYTNEKLQLTVLYPKNDQGMQKQLLTEI